MNDMKEVLKPHLKNAFLFTLLFFLSSCGLLDFMKYDAYPFLNTSDSKHRSYGWFLSSGKKESAYSHSDYEFTPYTKYKPSSFESFGCRYIDHPEAWSLLVKYSKLMNEPIKDRSDTEKLISYILDNLQSAKGFPLMVEFYKKENSSIYDNTSGRLTTYFDGGTYFRIGKLTSVYENYNNKTFTEMCSWFY
jgi:hypothetical protein